MISSRFRGPLGVQIIGGARAWIASGPRHGGGFRASLRLFVKSERGPQACKHVRHQSHLDPRHRLVHAARSPWVSGLQPRQLHLIDEPGLSVYAVVAYGRRHRTLDGQAVGQFFPTILATGSLIPLECYEIFERPRPLRVAILLVNIVIVIYLIANRDKLTWVHLRHGSKVGVQAHETGDDSSQRR